jgi:sugar phosphate isomerase/epimerase
MEKPLRHSDSVGRIADLSGKYKLPIIGTSYDGLPFWQPEKHSAILDDASTVLERVAKLGGRIFGVSVGDAGRKKTREELDAQGEMIRKLQSVAANHKVVLNLHNHMYEVRDDEHDLKGSLARVPTVKLGPDLDWLTGAHVNPVDFLKRHRDRIVYLHLRDRAADLKWTEALGEGLIDYPAVARTLREIGFHGDIAVELAHERGFRLTRPLRESWKMSREYVRRVLGY